MSFSKVIQKAWHQQARWLILLRPLSWLYGIGFKINHLFYHLGIKHVYHAPVPVLIVGNITVGGSGKTPLIIQLVRYLQQHQVNIAVISRGYGGKGTFPALVTLNSTPDQVGDEPCLIVQSTRVPMAVGSNRQQSIELLLNHDPNIQLIISDDGLQHWALQRDIEWIVYDAVRGLGNEKLLPEGFLRESKQRLQHATVIEHHPTSTALLNMSLKVGQPYLLFDHPKCTFDTQHVFHVVVGIGYPERFYLTLQQLGIHDFYPHEFADHHQYTIHDLQFNIGHSDEPIITTEKDAVKLRLLLQSISFTRPIWVIPVQAHLSNACYDTLKQQLADHHIEI